jgi:hypothetical protein
MDEKFSRTIMKEYKTYNPTWADKVDGETDFDNFLRSIFSSKGHGIIEIGEEVYQGFEYYRFVRNGFAHSEEKDVKKNWKTYVCAITAPTQNAVFSCSKDCFFVNQTLVFQIKFCGKSPAFRVAAIRSDSVNFSNENKPFPNFSG